MFGLGQDTTKSSISYCIIFRLNIPMLCLKVLKCYSFFPRGDANSCTTKFDNFYPFSKLNTKNLSIENLGHWFPMYVADEAVFKQRHYLFILWNNMDSEFILKGVVDMFE